MIEITVNCLIDMIIEEINEASKFEECKKMVI